MAWSDADKLHSIKDFLGAKTTSTVAPDFESWDNQSETHGAASYDEEEETVAEAAVPLPPAPEPAQEVVQERPAKRLKLVKTSPKPRPKIVKPEQPAPQPDPYQEYGASYDYGLAAQDYGSMLGLDQFVGAGASGTDSGEREGDTFKTMSREQKMRWFDQNGSDLLRDSSDENFRRLFGCGRGRTPAWKESFQVWCVKSYSCGVCLQRPFSPLPIFLHYPGAQGTSTTWTWPHPLPPPQASGQSCTRRRSRAFLPSFSLPLGFPAPALWTRLSASSRPF